MKTYLITAVTLLAVLLLGSGGLLVTHAATPNTSSSSTSQTLNLSLGGVVANAGNQNYLISQNGPAVAAVIDGVPLSSTHLTYTLNAQQQGLTTSGSATFTLTGQTPTGTTETVTGSIQIGTSIAGAEFPLSCDEAGVCVSCTSGCTSEVPYQFIGVGSIQITTGTATSSGNGFGNGNGNGNGYGNSNGNGNGNGYGNDNDHSYSGASNNSPAPVTLGMMLESAYFNPFGGPITIMSTDTAGSILIVTTYSQATINWSNVVDAGQMGGFLGTTQIVGTFTQVAVEHEDLVRGTATDAGVMTFSGVTDTSGNAIPQMDATGGYLGTSTIPTAGATSCGVAYCTETGFQDTGSFMLFGGHGTSSSLITGSYSTTWSIPAFGFISTVGGHVSQVGAFASAFSGKVSW